MTTHSGTHNVNPRTTLRRMAKKPMIKRTYYVPVALYEAVAKKAEEREENISDVIREALERYAKKSS